jgi:hypothetical protein
MKASKCLKIFNYKSVYPKYFMKRIANQSLLLVRRLAKKNINAALILFLA